MKNIRLIPALLLALLLTAAVMTACNSGEPTDPTVSDDSAAKTEAPTEAPTQAPAEKVSVTLTVKDQDGNPVTEATVTVLPADGEGESATLTANGEGSMTVSLPVGQYTVRFDVLPEYVLGIDVPLTVTAGMEPVTLEVTDNTPNGSEERPFVINEDTVTLKIPAETTYHFTMLGANNRTLTYTHAEVILLYDNGVYHPAGDGSLEVRMTTDSPRDHSYFALRNTGSAETEITVRFISDPGAMDNPIVIDALDTAITANVPLDGMVYYQWTATATGTLTVASADTINNISINNLATSQVSDFSAGGESVSLPVTDGDVITVVVSAIGGDRQAEYQPVTFTLSMSSN